MASRVPDERSADAGTGTPGPHVPAAADSGGGPSEVKSTTNDTRATAGAASNPTTTYGVAPRDSSTPRRAARVAVDFASFLTPAATTGAGTQAPEATPLTRPAAPAAHVGAGGPRGWWRGGPWRRGGGR